MLVTYPLRCHRVAKAGARLACRGSPYSCQGGPNAELWPLFSTCPASFSSFFPSMQVPTVTD